MKNSITCVIFAILLLLSFNLGQADHPVIHDTGSGNALIVAEEAATH